MTSTARLAAMREAIWQGNIKKVELLLKAGVPADGVTDLGDTFLSAAVVSGNVEIFELLVNHGANIDEAELLELAVGDAERPTHQSIFDILLERTKPTQKTLNEALRYACASGEVEFVRELLIRKANPNKVCTVTFQFPLLNAVDTKNATLVQLLLDAGADPEKHKIRDRDFEGKSFVINDLLNHARNHSTNEIADMIETAILNKPGSEY